VYAVYRADDEQAAALLATQLPEGVALVDPPANLRRFGGEWLAGPSLAASQASAVAVLNAACDAALAPLTARYPEREVLSWPQQIAEATAWAANPAADVPLLRTMAAERPSLGTSLDDRVPELARRILANAAVWSAVAGPILGRRQAIEDQIEACASPEAVADVVIDLGGLS
jgi:hypothetical protein